MKPTKKRPSGTHGHRLEFSGPQGGRKRRTRRQECVAEFVALSGFFLVLWALLNALQCVIK